MRLSNDFKFWNILNKLNLRRKKNVWVCRSEIKTKTSAHSVRTKHGNTCILAAYLQKVLLVRNFFAAAGKRFCEFYFIVDDFKCLRFSFKICPETTSCACSFIPWAFARYQRCCWWTNGIEISLKYEEPTCICSILKIKNHGFHFHARSRIGVSLLFRILRNYLGSYKVGPY